MNSTVLRVNRASGQTAGSGMPQYFFRMANESVGCDNEGVELASLGDVRKEAVVLAAEILKDRPEIAWRDKQFCVEVEDENGYVVCVVKVSAEI